MLVWPSSKINGGSGKGNRLKGVQVPILKAGDGAKVSTLAGTLDMDLAEGCPFLLLGEVTFRIASFQPGLSSAGREKG